MAAALLLSEGMTGGAPRRYAVFAATAAVLGLAGAPLGGVPAAAEEPRVLSPTWRAALVAIGKGVDERPADRLPSGPGVAPVAPADASPGTAAPDPNRCALLLPGADLLTSSECLACHGRLGHGGHPYDLEYARWSADGAVPLRARDEAVRRGVFLPERQVRCVTCHDHASSWKYHLRVPRDAKVTHAVDRRRPLTYENPRALSAPRAGDDIGRKPLCLGCHAMD